MKTGTKLRVPTFLEQIWLQTGKDFLLLSVLCGVIQMIFLTNHWWDGLTECQLLPWVWRESEAKQGHAGDEDAGHNQVEEIVECPPADVDGEGDVHIGLRTAVVRHTVLLPGNSWSVRVLLIMILLILLIICCLPLVKSREEKHHTVHWLTD